ncbi:HAD family hydrolase [bacterium]|nr:HAD family hydrolase [bacterium]
MRQGLLFDLGGTLWDDWPAELEYWRICTELLTEAGFPCTVDDFIRDSAELIRRYTPSLNRALVWKYSGRDAELAARIREEASQRIWDMLEDDDILARLYPLWPGIHDVLDELAQAARLGVVSMHGSRVRGVMQRMGLMRHFEELALCDERGFHKPDPRIIAWTLESMGLEAADCVMIGDRIDNDVHPAKVLGLSAVWLQVHPYDIQEPRYETDMPDLTITDMRELPTALRSGGWL